MAGESSRVNVLQRATAWLGIYAPAERKSIIGANGLGDWSLASRQDGINFRTNMVTLAEYQDSGAGGAQGALGLAAGWACVNLIAGTIGSLPLGVYERDAGGNSVPARNHPLYRVLHDSPNADQTAADFWEFVCFCLELHGNAFCEVERAGNGRVIALDVPMAPELVTVRRDNGALQYELSDGGRRRVIPGERILHIRGPGGSPLGGISTVAAGARMFGLARTLETSASATFRNGMRPSVALETDKPFTKEQRQLAEDRLGEKYQGAMNSGTPFISDNGLKIKTLSITPEDSQMLESRAFSVEQICMMFNVPPHMIGHTEKTTSWGTGIEQQQIGFVQFTLRRRLNRIEQALEKQLLTPAEKQAGLSIEFNLEGLLRGDSKTRAEFHASGLQNGWRTINEVRATENLPPVPGGDVPRMQSQNVPIDAPPPEAQAA